MSILKITQMKRLFFLALFFLNIFCIYGQEKSNLSKGITYYQMRDYVKANEYFDKSIKENPENSEPYYYKALIFFTSKDYEDGLRLLSKAIEVNPSNVKYYENRGNLYASLNQMDKAIKDLKKAIELDSLNSKRHFILASIYLNKGDLVNSIKYFESCLNLNEMHLLARFQKAICNIQLGNKQESFNDFSFILEKFDNYRSNLNDIELNNLHGISFNFRGQIYAEQKIYDKSASDFKNAIIYIENDAEIYNNLGHCMLFTNEVENSIEYLNKSIKIAPSPKNFINRSFAYYKLEKYYQAEQDALEAKKIDVNYPAIYYNLALIYKKTAKLNEACLMKKKAISLGYAQAEKIELMDCN